MRISRAFIACAIGFMVGVFLSSAFGFSWLLIVFLGLGAVSAGVFQVSDRFISASLPFFIFLSVLAGFLRDSTFNESFNESKKTFWDRSRSVLMEKASGVLPPSESAVFNAMVFGYEKDISENLKNSFNNTGTRHVLAISGMNISIIAMMLMSFGLAIGMWRKRAFWIAVIGVVSFIFLVGSPPSAVRAGIMGIILLWSKNRGRLVCEWKPVVIAGFFMVAADPTLLVFDIGFQLSFLAVLGIIFFKDFWDRVFKRFPIKFVRDLLSLSMSAQITTLPVMVYNFGTVSVISPIANIFVVPILTPIMFLGLGFAIFNWWIFAAKFFLWPCWLILKATVVVVEFFGSLSWASVDVGKAGLILYVVYYPLLILFWKFLDKKGLNEKISPTSSR